MFSFLQFGQSVKNGELTDRFKRDDNDEGLTMKSYTIASSVTERFSTINIQSRLQNNHSYTVKSKLLVHVPEAAFISNFSIVINGSEYVGKIVANEERDEAIRNRTETQLNVEVKFSETNTERGINIFEIDITLEAGGETTLSLTYNELLERRLGLYTQKIFVYPGQVVDTLAVSAIVLESQGFETFSYSVPHSEKSVLLSSVSNPTVNSVLYQPTKKEQTTVSSKGINGQLVIEYDLKHEKDAGNVIVEGGYFVHYFTPSGLKTMDKNILFVIDDSGSMSGTKIRQVRESMLSILDNLNPNDYTNILKFSTSVQTWLPMPAVASSENIAKAKTFVNDNLDASGGTNINDALIEAIQSLKSSSVNVKRAQIIFFLTDGQPSTGITDTEQIRKNVMEENEGFAAIYCLGFGFNLDYNFLKNLAYENNGFSRPIYEDEDATEQLVDIYNEIKDPFLLDVKVNYDSKYVELNSTTNNKFYQYFNGTEIVVAGKLKKSGVLPADTVLVQGLSKDGNLDLKMTSRSITIRPLDENSSNKKLQDIKKIKQLIGKYSTYNNAESEKAKQDAIKLAIENNFITKFTSFVLQVKSPTASRNKVMCTIGFGTAFTAIISLMSLWMF
ncbi:hypothetical protein LOTGIDRAFT_126343 [Lottia gigantea]|uniref:VWFA domain-containing protein n=1 Tax=Lottia gigantea TaxID=225164 RepID=V3ZVH4_LOTGI|nr:hypothetical protein LOTGIDRAFT_126343 [Lottia gigantea]ESO88337.1 hypothetical protein LOTGIDRAFT_126343 [Lottia gigantea]